MAKTKTLSLPTKPKPIDNDISNYLTLIYGREKIGKTTIAASYPKAIFLATEPGLRGLKAFSFNDAAGGVTDWNIFREAVELLLNDKGQQFQTVIIDTVDKAYDMCLKWVCDSKGIDYPGKDNQGKSDFGKSWAAVKTEFTYQITRLVQANYGIVFTSHVKEVTHQTRSGEEYDRIYPSMSNQARAVIEALVDFFFYAEYMKDTEGNQIRVLICEGDEAIWAGARPTPGGKFPKYLPLLEDGFHVIQEAFNGTEKGIPQSSLSASKNTTETVTKVLMEEKAKANRKRSAKGGVSKKKKIN